MVSALSIKTITPGLLLILLLLVAACGEANNTPAPSPTVQSGTVGVSTQGTGPIVLLTPTSAPGGSVSQQAITLADRTLTLVQVSRAPGADASSTAVSLTITITNTASASIQNNSTFYQLIDAEGDVFGTQSSVTPGFYGAIASHQSRRGTITFQVPTGAAQSLQLLYRPETATETVLVPLNK
jgi:Domain of unknown function (DUF4352)